MGLLQVDGEGKVLDFVEKPQEDEILKNFKLTTHEEPHYLGSMGIYVFRRESLVSLLHGDPRDDFGFHLITTAVQQNTTYAFLYQGYWEDIGTVASYYEANLMLTEEKKGLDTYDETNPIYSRPSYLPGPRIKSTKISSSIICEGCIIEAEEISHSVIGLRSHIQSGTIIRDTVIMGNQLYMPPLSHTKSLKNDFGVGKNCLIAKAIIDEYVQIGDNVKLINEKKLEFYDGEGIFIRDGIIIVVAGTTIADGFVL
jgi:glucose-1-phosphate adenylyltransferase